MSKGTIKHVKFNKLSDASLTKLEKQADDLLAKFGTANGKRNAKIHNLGRGETSAIGKTEVTFAHGERWTPEQESIVKADFKAKLPLKVTAAKIGKSPVAVWVHRKQMGLTGKGTRTVPVVTDETRKISQAYNAALVKAKVEAYRQKA